MLKRFEIEGIVLCAGSSDAPYYDVAYHNEKIGLCDEQMLGQLHGKKVRVIVEVIDDVDGEGTKVGFV